LLEIGSANGDIEMRRERSRLVLTVEDDGTVLDLRLRHDPLFFHIHHVAIAIVVVADILLLEPRHRSDLILGPQVLPVPRDDHVLTIGIQRWPQHQDHVAQNRVDVKIILCGDEFVASAIECWLPATSEECNLPSICTMTLEP
jgi:hypothetical protein